MKRARPALFNGLCIRRYLRFGLSFRNLEELVVERHLNVDHVTIWRWVQRYAPELSPGTVPDQPVVARCIRARHFFQKALRAPGRPRPRVIKRGWEPLLSEGHFPN